MSLALHQHPAAWYIAGYYLQIVNAFEGVTMPDTTCHMSISLDGFVAGPDQSREHPLGKRGRDVHGWHIGDERANEADETATGWLMRPRGAYVMGRNMFGPIRGEWEEDWRGWWGPEPLYHAPVFVLTHHAREPIEMEGGTTFHFVTDGFDAAYAQARDGRRRRRGHRGRRLHRSAGARCRGRRRAHARHRPSPARVRRTNFRRRRISWVGARRGAAFAAGHAHPLPPSELKAGFRDVHQSPLRVSRCGRPATRFGRPASASRALEPPGASTSTVWAVWWSQSSTAFFTRETLTRLSHLIRLNELSWHKRSGEPRSVREEMSRRPAPRSKPPDVPAAQRVQRGDHRSAHITSLLAA